MDETRETQTLTSEWGREPLTVGIEVPTVALRWLLARKHVGTPDSEIQEWAENRVKLAEERGQTYTAEQRRETIAAALWLHAEQRTEYARVMSGRF